MKQLFTLLFLAVSFCAFGQIPVTSPYPGVFRVESPSSVAGEYSSGKQDGWGDTLSSSICGPLVWAFGDSLVGIDSSYIVETTLVTYVVDSTLIQDYDTVGLVDDLGNPYDSIFLVNEYFELIYDDSLLTTTELVISPLYDKDSLVCNPILTQDLTGKVALIRRGDCFFTSKAFRAQQAGALGSIIVNHYSIPTNTATFVQDMGIGTNTEDTAALINTPTLFISRQTGETLIPLIEAGVNVEICFYVPTIWKAHGPLAYASPLNEQVPLRIAADWVNFNSTNETVNLTVSITNPAGTTETFTENFVTQPDVSTTMNMDAIYEPSMVGTYNLTFTNDVNDDVLTRNFIVTDSLWALDNLAIDGSTAVSAADFVAGALQFGVGSLYFTDETTADELPRLTTHATFAIQNPVPFHATTFEAILYDVDSDGTDSVESWVMNSFGAPIAFTTVDIDSTVHLSQQLITVEFDEPGLLQDNKAYALMIRFDGVVSPPVGDAVPAFSSAGSAHYQNVATLVYTNVNDPVGGWADSDVNNVVRMNRVPFSGTNDQALAADQVSVYPNPANDRLFMDVELSELSATANMTICTYSGQIVKSVDFQNVKTSTLEVGIAELAEGVYFATLYTAEGFRTKMFKVAR
jgi:PA domain/Secretion system C-terminal sorting domain